MKILLVLSTLMLIGAVLVIPACVLSGDISRLEEQEQLRRKAQGLEPVIWPEEKRYSGLLEDDDYD